MVDKWKMVKKRDEWRGWRPRVYVSVNGRGEIVMNGAAFGLIREPASVCLLYRPPTTPSSGSRGTIGVKFPVGSDENYFPVRRYGRGRRMRIVRGGLLLKQFGIALEGTLAFVNPETESFRGSPMIVLPLDKGRAVKVRRS